MQLTRDHVIGSLLVLAVLLTFYPVLGHEFLEWDDSFNVFENPRLNPVTWRHICHFWRHPTEHHMYPLTSTLWALIALVARRPDHSLDPAFFHAANVVLHALAALVVYRIFLAVLASCTARGERGLRIADGGARTAASDTRSATRPPKASRSGPSEAQSGMPAGPAVQRAAAAGALLFALHPLQAEPVAWVTGGKDLLSGLLGLTALWLLLPVLLRPAALTPRRATVRYAGSTAVFALSLAAKPTAAVIPILAFLFWAAARACIRHTRAPHASPPGAGRAAPRDPHSSVLDPRPLGRAPLFCVLLLWLALGIAWGSLTKDTQRDELLSFVPRVWSRLPLALDALAFYLYKLVAPFRLGPDYGRSPAFVLRHSWLYLTWLVPVGWGIVAWFSKRRAGWLLASALAVAGLLPVLGLVAFAHQVISTVADRYVYLAMLGPALAGAWLLQTRPDGRRLGAAALVLAGLAVASHRQTRHWHDTVSLFRHALEVNPRSALSHYNLGLVAGNAGDFARAAARYREAIRLEPNHVKAHNNLGNVLARTGRLKEAFTHFSKALEIHPRFAGAHYNMAYALELNGQPREALLHYSRTLALDPAFADAHDKLAMLFFREGDMKQAVLHARRHVAMAPADKEARNNLATLLLRDGKIAEALVQYSAALRLDPDYADAHYNIGIAFLEAENLTAAEHHFREALRCNPSHAGARRYLEFTRKRGR
ncbi:MAG: tetratricopeptide repeat protein [Kiritimatiellae bacterium]|nr:tetratricopeptide repeat protein [Kiritimatiellia bacterium]